MNKFSFLFLSLVVFVSCDKKIAKIAPPSAPVTASFCDSIKYTKYIKPIITKNCAYSGCHISGFSYGDFTSYSGVKLKVDNSLFKTRVFDSPLNPMPPSGQLSQSQRDSIKCWLDKGAPNN